MKWSFQYLVILLLSCGGVKDTAISQSVQNYPLTTVIESAHGGPDLPKIIVAKEPSAVKEFYNYVNRTRKPGLAIPKVDYHNSMIVIFCMGRKNTGGYSVGIESIYENDDSLIITVKEKAPEDQEIVPQVITHPFTVIKMKKTDKKIVFKKAA